MNWVDCCYEADRPTSVAHDGQWMIGSVPLEMNDAAATGARTDKSDQEPEPKCNSCKKRMEEKNLGSGNLGMELKVH